MGQRAHGVGHWGDGHVGSLGRWPRGVTGAMATWGHMGDGHVGSHGRWSRGGWSRAGVVTWGPRPVSYTHLRAHETLMNL
eukprot:3435196-Prymnesium_polylepis.1